MREIIVIDEDKCNGCGLCIPECPEGALQIIDGKARLVSDLFCDGLGACMGYCPEGALTTEKREAEPYSEKKAMENIAPKGKNTIIAHLKHLDNHNETEFLAQAIAYLNEQNIPVPEYGVMKAEDEVEEIKESHSSCGGGCPGSQVIDMRDIEQIKENESISSQRQTSELKQWPIQMELLHPGAPYFQNSDLLIAADGVAFANANFHKELLKGRAIMIACPKHNGQDMIYEKIKAVLEMNTIKSITVAIMEVPCCFSLYGMTQQALEDLGKTDIPLKKIVVGINGDIR